jgi:hypothetical protein
MIFTNPKLSDYISLACQLPAVVKTGFTLLTLPEAVNGKVGLALFCLRFGLLSACLEVICRWKTTGVVVLVGRRGGASRYGLCFVDLGRQPLIKKG